jgi:DNA-binding response OmpR family regulator
MASVPRPGSLASRLGQSSTILVVEDEPDIATFLGAFFRASGTQVVHLDPESASDAVEAAVQLGAACALVDLNLGGISGFDILEAIRDDHRVSLMPVVIVTADSRPATRERAVGLGAAAFIPKPFNVKDLFATVKALVEGDPLLGDAGEEASDTDATLRRGALRGGLLPADVLAHRLAAAVAGARRERASVAFAIVRLVGSAAGQPAVVSELATHLDSSLGGAEVLGASAPDELAVLFPACDATRASAALAAAIGSEPVELVLPAGRTVSARCTAGVASSPEHATTGDELYMAADAALADAVESDQPVAVAR